jgi:hypothetical protein
MEWINTPESSNIAGFGYNESIRILTVEFKNGGRYEYFDVSMDVFNAMKAASSKGQFLAQSIKGQFRYARV